MMAMLRRWAAHVWLVIAACGDNGGVDPLVGTWSRLHNTGTETPPVYIFRVDSSALLGADGPGTWKRVDADSFQTCVSEACSLTHAHLLQDRLIVTPPAAANAEPAWAEQSGGLTSGLEDSTWMFPPFPVDLDPATGAACRCTGTDHRELALHGDHTFEQVELGDCASCAGIATGIWIPRQQGFDLSSDPVGYVQIGQVIAGLVLERGEP
jgi:hypothetical protein